MDKRSLAQLAGMFRKSEAQTKTLREAVATAIRQATADGVPQKDICEVTGYTRQQVRRIVIADDTDTTDDA